MAKILIDEDVLDKLLLKSLPSEYEVLLDDDALSEEEQNYNYCILFILSGQIDEAKRWVSTEEFKEILDNIEKLQLNFFDDFKVKLRVFIEDKFGILIAPLLAGFYVEANRIAYTSLNKEPILTDGDLLNLIGIKQYNYNRLTNLCDDLSQNFKDIILNGIIKGKSVGEISEELELAGISPLYKHTAQQRAKMIARTEVNSVKNKARLQAYKDNNIELVNINTMGDSRVCQDCLDVESKNPYLIDEAWDILPLHPNCRCYYSIANNDKNYNVYDEFGETL